MSVNLNTSLNAAQRGWGSGWPSCQTSKIKPLEYDSLAGSVVKMRAHHLTRHADGSYEFTEDVGIPAGTRPEIHDLALLLLRESELRGYINLHDGWCWGFACRAIKTSTGGTTNTPSNHSWGLALDLNAPVNGFGAVTHQIGVPMARELWNPYGFRWGGDYSSTKDWMHFEFLGTPADAKALTEKARSQGIGGDELTPQEQQTLKDAQAFLEALRDGLEPGKEKATASGAGNRVAATTRKVEAAPTP